MVKIVMIDDDPALRGLVSAFLESQGWAFSGAADARAGLALVAGEKPDLVLLDVNLPDMDGFNVCARLRANAATKRIPIILISGGHTKSEDQLKGLSASGADDYIIKPVHLAVLKAKLDAVLHSCEDRR